MSSVTEFIEARYARARAAFEDVDPWVREDLWEALNWARNTLRDHEGAGHIFQIIANQDRLLMCAFAKPQWNADHCSCPMGTAEEAIVMAVCEYLNGC